MPGIEVELPDGSIAEFPDDMAQDKISEAVQTHLKTQAAAAPGAHIAPRQPTWSEALGEINPAVTRGVTGAVGGLLEGVGALTTPSVKLSDSRSAYDPNAYRTADDEFEGHGQPVPVTPNQMADVAGNPAYQAGKYVADLAKATDAPTSRTGKIAESAGAMIPLALSGPVAPATIGAQALGETLDNEYQQAKIRGLSDEQASDAAIKTGFENGLTQAAIWAVLPGPIKKLLGKATGLAGEGAVKQFVARRVAGAAEGATLGAASQAGGNIATGKPVGQNVVPAAVGVAGLGAVTMGPERASVPDVIKQAKAAGLPQAAAEAAKNLAEKGGETDASKNEETTEVHGDVREQPGEGQGEVSKQGGGKGVHPSGEEPETPADVVLSKGESEDVEKRLENPDTFKGKNWTTDALRYGAGLDHPDQLAELKRLETKYSADMKAIPKTVENFGKISQIGYKKQWVTEAIQGAEGIGDSDPARAALGNDYKPPFPKGESKEVSPNAKEEEKTQGDVLTPAVKTDEGIYSGQKRHNEIVLDQAKNGVDATVGERGFLHKGKFIDRAEAARIYEEQTGRKPAKAGELHSEDLLDSGYFKEKTGQPAVVDQSVNKAAEPQPIGAGPGAATRPVEGQPTDIGTGESNIPPLERLADAVSRFPKQPGGGFKEKLRQWMDDVGIPTKDFAARALVGVKAATANVINAVTKLAPVTTMDRAVGEWNIADTEGDIAARRFDKAVKDRFPDRAKLRAFSNWINAGGDKELLQRQADLTKDPELKKTYTDALHFGPDEEQLGADIKQYHDEMLAEAMRAGALEEGLENYIHRYYPRESDPARQRLQGALNEMRFTKNFSGFKKRFYDSDFEAEQAGLKPEKDAAKRILAYDQGFRKALTARAFVKDRYKATMPDGRPEIDVTGIGVPSRTDVDTGKETPYLVKPKSKAGGDSPEDYRGDYVTFDHPAFRRWKWVGQDANGKPILMEGEMSVHPDAVRKYRALFERSWFQENPVGKALLIPSNFVKQTMLALSAFHPVQIGIHAIEHKVNPFKLVDLNTRDPAQAELIKGGLTVADLDGGSHFSEGVGGSGLFGKIPIAGEIIKGTQDWLFKDFIPRIKMTMALDALQRNLGEAGWLSEKSLVTKAYKAGEISREQVVRLTARESNAAFGEQNYRAMFRHKGFQDLLRFAFLAPDFGEARLRFPLQAATKYGGEQRMALVLGAVGMFVAAKTAEKLMTGKMNLNKPFTVTVNYREYGLRNVASDLYHMITDPAGYLRNRLNPIYTRPALEMLSGRDAFGRKRTAGQQVLDEAKQIVPISARGAVEKDQNWWESFINAIGLTEHRASAFGQAMQAVNKWKDKKGYTEPGEFVYDADKDPYSKLTTALTYGSPGDARKQLDALTEGKTPAEARKIAAHYRRSLEEHPYLTGSRAHEQEYVKSLDAGAKAQYDEAKAERKAMWQKFVKAWRSKFPATQ